MPHAVVHLGKDQHLGQAVHVLQLHKGHHRAGLGGLQFALGDDAAHEDQFLIPGHAAVGFLGKPLQYLRIDLQFGKFGLVFVQRVAGDINARHLALHAQLILPGKLGKVGQRRRGDLHILHRVKQRKLPLHGGLLPAAGGVDGALVHAQFLGAVAGQRVHGPGADQAFHALFVHRRAGHALAEVEDVPVRTARLALGDDGLYGPVAEVFHPREAKADGSVFHGELLLRFVHVRRQHADAALSAGLDIVAHLVGIAGEAVHQRRHELHGPVQFQPRRLHGDEGVGGGVGFVEGVAGKGGHFVEDMLGHILRHAVAHRAGHGHFAVFHLPVDENFLFFGHDVVLFLGHGAAHQIAAAIGIAGQIAHDLHHLFLIDHAAVGDVEDGLE